MQDESAPSKTGEQQSRGETSSEGDGPLHGLNTLGIIEPAIQELRLQRLRVALKVLLAIGFAFLLYIFAASFFSTTPSEKVYETRRLSIINQAPGSVEMYNWNGRPILVLRRSPEQIASLGYLDAELQDANSQRSKQPEFAQNEQRSRSAEWFVAIASGTDMSCSIDWLPASDESFRGEPWPGGFADSCRGSRYDVAGRVFAGQQAKKNLSVPPYSLPEPGVLVLGGR